MPYVYPFLEKLPADWERGDDWPWANNAEGATPDEKETSEESAPKISFSRNEGTDRIEVVSASSNVHWDGLEVRAGFPGQFGFNKAPAHEPNLGSLSISLSHTQPLERGYARGGPLPAIRDSMRPLYLSHTHMTG
jgi:hypothetical protein